MFKSVFCLADNQEHAQRIVDRLLNVGFDNDAISVLMANTSERGTEFVEHDVVVERNFEVEREVDAGTFHKRGKPLMKGRKGVISNATKSPEGATTGAVAGGIIGGSLGLLAGIGALAIPGLGPFIAAGPLMAALAGSGVGGSLGLVVGALVGLGIPEYEAKKYEVGLQSGDVLICVHAADSDEVDRAKEVFHNEGAHAISTSKEKVKSGRK